MPYTSSKDLWAVYRGGPQGGGRAHFPPFFCLGNRERFLGSAMGIAIGNRKNRCDNHFGALSSYKQGVECWMSGNHRNHGNDENHGNPGCKPQVPETMNLKLPEKPKDPPLGVATPAEPRGEKKLFFVLILGGEKLLKFVEKCR